MKPISITNSKPGGDARGNSSFGIDRGNSPITDYFYQPALESHVASGAIAEKTAALRELCTFRSISSEFARVEAGREYVAEAIYFVAISLVAAWPIAVALHQLTRWMI
jgi:hypothetical protein